MKSGFTDQRIWIAGPIRDLAWFVLSPLWIVFLLGMIRVRFDVNVFGSAALAIGGIGHHLPGFIRAYTDPALFRRFRIRFIVAPLFLIGVCLAFTAWHLQSLKLILALWGAWHGAMQINGFLRIYDSKVESYSPATAWLDWAICLVWFGGGLWHSPLRMIAILSYFYTGGGPEITPTFFKIFCDAWDILTVCVTLAFLINAWRQASAGRAANPVKFLLMASSFGFWWFCMVHLDNLLVALLIFEIFHDMQYNALVWIYNQRRVAQNLATSSVEKFLFQPAPARIAVYALLVLAYGWFGSVTDYAKVQAPDTLQAGFGSLHFWTALFIASALLHFYFDGFIWRVREGDFRKGLGIEKGQPLAKGAGPSPHFQLSGLVPGWKWLLFGIPVLWLGLSEQQGKGIPLLNQYQNLAALFPKSWPVNFVLGMLEKSNGDYNGAAGHFEQALALHPDFEPAQAMVGDIYFHAGNAEMAANHYLKASSLDSNDFEMEDHFSTLLLSQNRVNEAIPHLMRAVRGESNDTTLVFLLGAALMQNHRVPEAVPYLYRTVDLDPRHMRALNYLGIAAQMSGNFPAAIQYFQRALEVDSEFQEARNNLARAQQIMAAQKHGP